MQTIADFLSSIPGVIESAFVRPEDVPEIRAKEEANEKRQLAPVKNLGMRVVLERDTIVVLLKDGSFRSPPTPTIYMVEVVDETADPEAADAEGDDPHSDHYLDVSGERFHIVGEEVMGDGPNSTEKRVFFERSFVLFPERRMNRNHVPAFMILPPIAFPELEEVKAAYAIDNVFSISPSSECDDYIRSAYSFSKLPEYATILIGWDSAEA